MNDKPLHVQVAEILGWTECHDRGDGLWEGLRPVGEGLKEVLHFDRSFCATGPLLEKFEIEVHPMLSPGMWWAKLATDNDGVEGQGVCGAVCNLIVQLHKEGKLPA